MKKQNQPDYNKQVKILSKYFRNFDQEYVRLIFQFCDFQAILAYKVLQILKDFQTPGTFIKKLVDYPNQSDQLIKQLQIQYNKKYEKVNPQIQQQLKKLTGQQIIKQKIINENIFNFFQYIPKDIYATIMYYLDPYSFSKISQINKKFYNISNSQVLHFYFKNLCLKIFKYQQPKLPQQCRFIQIRKYVQEHPADYGPNIKNAVINNLRYYVWKTQPKSFKIDKNYYKSFGNYKNLYLKAPRINFNGTYVCKHKYVRIGEKGFKYTITPLIVCYYYRYVRFFPDGSLLSFITSNKVKKQQIAQMLSNQKLLNFDPHNTDQLKVGQYMQYKNTLYMKIVKCNTIFTYQLQIISNNNKISDQLMVISYNLEMVDERQIVQKLYEYKEGRQKILFNYLRNDMIEEQKIDQMQGASM